MLLLRLPACPSQRPRPLLSLAETSRRPQATQGRLHHGRVHLQLLSCPNATCCSLTPQHWQQELAALPPNSSSSSQPGAARTNSGGTRSATAARSWSGSSTGAVRVRCRRSSGTRKTPSTSKPFSGSRQTLRLRLHHRHRLHQPLQGRPRPRTRLSAPLCLPAADHQSARNSERKDAFCFAGAYYVRYPERTRDLGNLLSALADFGRSRFMIATTERMTRITRSSRIPPFIVGNLPSTRSTGPTRATVTRSTSIRSSSHNRCSRGGSSICSPPTPSPSATFPAGCACSSATWCDQ